MQAEPDAQPQVTLPAGLTESLIVRSLLSIALLGLTAGGVAWGLGTPDLANLIWAAGTVPVTIGLFVSILRALLAGRVGVDAVALVSMSGALALGEMLAAIVVAVMYAGGSVLEDYAMARAERDLRSLVDRAPRVAHRSGPNGIRDIPVEAVTPGDKIQVNAGEVVPVDGRVLSTIATIDESAMTGEPLAVDRVEGSAVLSGTVNAGATFFLQATATATDSAYAGVIRMVRGAQKAKAPFIRAADRFALLLLPLTLMLAGAAWFYSGDPVRGLAVLVAATPCPLILAAPVAFIGGVSRAARRGILVKGGAALESLAGARTVIFDKTGTLTIGGARVIAIEAAPGQNHDEILTLAATLDRASHHVVAEAIVAEARERGLTLGNHTEVLETQGEGVAGRVGGRDVRVGSQGFALDGSGPEAWVLRALRRAAWRSALSVFVSVDGKGIGAILLGDEIRADAPRTIRTLRAAGISRIVMLTGDQTDVAESIGNALMLDEVLAERSVAEKVDAVAAEQRRAPAIMVGDGINDAPSLAAASAGIAMGARGASAASEAADVVILLDRVDRVSDAVTIARRTRGIALQSMITGLTLSGLAMGAAALGWLTPVEGALTQEAIDVAVILNALRTLLPERGERRVGLSPGNLAALKAGHRLLEPALDRLCDLSDTLETAAPKDARATITEARDIVRDVLISHEDEDDARVFPEVQKFLSDGEALAAMQHAHLEIHHLYRQLEELLLSAGAAEIDSCLIRDAQRIIETLETVIRIHNAQEEDIYEYATSA